MEDYIRKCKNKACGITFRTDLVLVEYCSEECYNASIVADRQAKALADSLERYKDDPDIPTCKICGFKSPNLIQHIFEAHGVRQKTYMRKYKAKIPDLYSKEYREKVPTHGNGDKANCKNCGVEFEKSSPHQVYCSEECFVAKTKEGKRIRDAIRYPRRKAGLINAEAGRQLVCKQCKKEYTTHAPNSTYCSRKCLDRWFYEKRKKDHTKHCKRCGGEMEKFTKDRFCGKKCRDAALRDRNLKKTIAQNLKKYKGIEGVPVCKECGFKGKVLHTHINAFHDMTAEQYCKKHDVNMEELTYAPIAEANRIKNKQIFERKYKEYIERTRAEARNKYRHA